jgi:chemotaxis signal transduction protein
MDRDRVSNRRRAVRGGSRVLHLATRDVPTAVVVSEVFGFRRFAVSDFSQEPADTAIRCERYLSGTYRRGGESWPLFKFSKLVEDDQFLQAGEQVAA